MRRYGFSNRWAVSPFSSQDGVPNVTDDDYSYITSADLEDHGVDVPRPYAPQSHTHDHYSHSVPSRPEDDVILIKYQGVTYPEHFPAYSIGDGKLLASDVRERVVMIMDLSERQAKRIKLYYKGRRLKKFDLPVREYGVKNNSELLMVLGDSPHGSSTGSESSEEVVVVGNDERERYEPRTSPRVGRSGGWGERSPRDSSSRVGLGVPSSDDRRRGTSRVRTQSPGSAVSAGNAPAAVPRGKPGGPIEKLNAIADEFTSQWLPDCLKFAASPPKDTKKREKEYRRLSETIMAKILLNLDAVDVSTEEGARARRKQLVIDVQSYLHKIDAAAKSST